MKWAKRKLGDICHIQSGGTPSRHNPEYWNGEFPWIKIDNINDATATIDISSVESINTLGLASIGGRLFPAGTLLFAMYGASIGKMAFAPSQCACNQAILGINRKENKCDIRFVFHYLKFQKQHLISEGRGGAQPNLSAGYMKNLYLPLPPPTEQRRIAAILDKADAIRRKRQQSLELADNLLKSVFLDMFGDPVTNPKGWGKGTIRDIVSDVNYGTSKPAADGGKYIYLRMNNITYSGSLDLTNVKHINATDSDLKKYSVCNGDVLFNRTNSKELVGKTCVFTEDTQMIIAGYIIRVRVNSKAVPQYLSATLNSSYGKTTLLGMCKSIIGQANINAQELQDIKILIPPIELQQKFANIVASIEVRKHKLNAHFAEANHAFKSLQQSFFG